MVLNDNTNMLMLGLMKVLDEKLRDHQSNELILMGT